MSQSNQPNDSLNNYTESEDKARETRQDSIEIPGCAFPTRRSSTRPPPPLARTDGDSLSERPVEISLHSRPATTGVGSPPPAAKQEGFAEAGEPLSLGDMTRTIAPRIPSTLGRFLPQLEVSVPNSNLAEEPSVSNSSISQEHSQGVASPSSIQPSRELPADISENGPTSAHVTGQSQPPDSPPHAPTSLPILTNVGVPQRMHPPIDPNTSLPPPPRVRTLSHAQIAFESLSSPRYLSTRMLSSASSEPLSSFGQQLRHDLRSGRANQIVSDVEDLSEALQKLQVEAKDFKYIVDSDDWRIVGMEGMEYSIVASGMVDKAALCFGHVMNVLGELMDLREREYPRGVAEEERVSFRELGAAGLKWFEPWN